MNNPLDPSLRELNDCGCGAGVAAETPQRVANRPGLTAVACRAGTQPQFKASLLAALSSSAYPALGALRTRDDRDFTIGLLDAWACVADVLTFYSERIANEAYLRTATERRSVLELARAIGYELKPGVAASTWLAFTVEDAQGAPGYAYIPAGTKVQSLPGPDEKPQTYETVAPVVARKEWNELPIRHSARQPLAYGERTLELAGTQTRLQPGDALLLVDDARVNNPDSLAWDLRFVQTVAVQTDANGTGGRTRVTLDTGVVDTAGLPLAGPDGGGLRVFALRRRARAFGYNAPDWRILAKEVKVAYGARYAGAPEQPDLQDWPHHKLGLINGPPPGETGTGLWGSYHLGTQLDHPDRVRLDATVDFDSERLPPHAEDVSFARDRFSVRWSGWLLPAVSGTYQFVTESDDGVRLVVGGHRVIDNWTDHGRQTNRGELALEAGRKYPLELEYYERGGAAVMKLSWLPPTTALEVVPTARLFPVIADQLHLEAVYPGILAGSWVALVNASGARAVQRVVRATETARSGFLINAPCTRLQLDRGGWLARFDDRVRDLIVLAESEELAWAETPLPAWVRPDTLELAQTVPALARGNRVAVRGLAVAPDASAGLVRTEIAEVLEMETVSGRPRIRLVRPLLGSYAPGTLQVFANLAPATHGESVIEVLGSGDASRAHQRFLLRRPPLTYVAGGADGTSSTLQIRVNDVRWEEVATLYGRGPQERVYVTRQQADARTEVLFGDGLQGARLPTGQENVRANYRCGSGLDGLVKAEQLSLLLARPLGVRSVTNPSAPAGAAEAQTLTDARANAPRTVLLLDRVVSLEDYVDFARDFPGVAKAHGVWAWNGHVRGVLLTVLGAGGLVLPPGEATVGELIRQLRRRGNERVPVRVLSAPPVRFGLQGTVRVASDREPDLVRAAVGDTLKRQFGFGSREFGQGIALSEVMAVIQQVPGVAMVDIDALTRPGLAAGIRQPVAYLGAYVPPPGTAAGHDAAAAELLILDESQLPRLAFEKEVA